VDDSLERNGLLGLLLGMVFCAFHMYSFSLLLMVLSVSTGSHLWIVAEASLVPMSLYVMMNKLKEVKWAQTQEHIALN
jgi:hypothetical protein